MSKHVFRNPDLFDVNPLRQFIRDEMPDGSDGFVVEDVDEGLPTAEGFGNILLRTYGPNYNASADGRYLFIEHKYRHDLTTSLGRAQDYTFRIVDHDLNQTQTPNYRGWYVVVYNKVNPDSTIPDDAKFGVRRLPKGDVAVYEKHEFVEWLAQVWDNPPDRYPMGSS